MVYNKSILINATLLSLVLRKEKHHMEELRNKKEENNMRKEDFHQSDLVKPDQTRPDYYPYNQAWLDWAFE